MPLDRRYTYEADPLYADTGLDVDEVNALLETNARDFYKDRRKVLHFLRRVVITISAYRQQIRVLQSDVAEMRTTPMTAGATNALSPLEAMKYLSPDQQQRVFAEHFQEKLAALDALAGQASSSQAALANERNRLRFALAQIMEDPRLDDDLRGRLAELADSVSSEPLPQLPAPLAGGVPPSSLITGPPMPQPAPRATSVPPGGPPHAAPAGPPGGYPPPAAAGPQGRPPAGPQGGAQ